MTASMSSCRICGGKGFVLEEGDVPESVASLAPPSAKVYRIVPCSCGGKRESTKFHEVGGTGLVGAFHPRRNNDATPE